jgi:CheY-like chemotaxis protein
MGKKILLADDSITIQKVIELTFSDEDFEVATVGNGRLAVEKLEEIRPDIVLCDIIMPEKDGYEVCEYVKKHASFSHVPVLLLTGAFEPFDQERAARVGCDGFLAKPFEPQALIAKVKDLLAKVASRPATRPLPAMQAPPPVAAAAPPPLPVAPPVAPQPAVMFIPEEPIVEEAPPGTFDEPMELTHEPGTPPPPYVPGPIEQEMYPAEEALEASPEEFMPLMADEAATLHAPVAAPVAAPALPAVQEPEEDDGSSTVVFHSSAAPPWSQPTVEVPLEARAQAGVQAAQEAAAAHEFPGPVFDDDVVEAPAPAVVPPPPALAAPLPAPEPEPEPVEAFEPASFEPDFGEPTPSPAPPPAAFVAPPPAPVMAAPAPPPTPEPAPVAEPEEVSFEDVAPAPAPPPAAPPAVVSGAAGVTVPVEQVAQIAQRVVAQISEKVVREIAWEVIPDLAEALIKKEIERLKAELDRS